jgi:DNA-binding NarL/FixJ family response regulator
MTPKAEAPMKSRVVVIEDHPVLRDALQQLIDGQPDLTCVGVADSTSDAKRLVEQCKPDLMVLDLRLKAGDALDLVKSLRVEQPGLKVLVLSQYDELIFAERALRAGAFGYIMKENATDEVLRALRKVLAGELYFSERVAAAVVQRKTVETHCEKIKHKLSLHNAAELKQFARKWAAENLAASEPWVPPPLQSVRPKK